MKKSTSFQKQKLLISSLLIALVMASLNLKAQDIIVKTNKSRINTKVLNFTDSLVKCNSFQNNKDSIFALEASEIDLILFEKGSIKYFNNMLLNENQSNKKEKEESNNKGEELLSDSLKNGNKKEESFVNVGVGRTKNYHTFEIGSGITAARALNGFYTNPNISPFQVNFRYLLRFSNPSELALGINANYSNIAFISVAKRYSLHGLMQIYLHNSDKFKLYLNGMAGIALFDYYPSIYYGDSSFYVGTANGILPSIHLGLGIKSFWAENSGYFIETGMGGPYLLNAGVFF